MVLSAAELERLRDEALADDVPIPAEARGWSVRDAERYFESGGALHPRRHTGATPQEPAPSARYEVVHDYVNVRSEPKLTGGLISRRAKGVILEIDPEAAADGWVRLRDRIKGSEAWVMVDGRQLGLGLLLKRLPEPVIDVPISGQDTVLQSPTKAKEVRRRLVAPVEFEVVHHMVYVRSLPDRHASSLGVKRKGDLVHAIEEMGDWIMLDGTSTPEWMMVDGNSAGLGKLMSMSIKRVEETWQVTRKGGCTLYSSPGGRIISEKGPDFGSSVKARCKVI